MLFCRTVLLSLIGSIWCATTPVQNGHWLRGRTRDISKTVRPDGYPLPTRVLRGEVLKENSAAWIGASSSDSDGIETDDIAPETSTGDMLPPKNHTTTLFRTQGISKTVPADDYTPSDLEVNSTALNDGASSSDNDETNKTDDIALTETNTDEMFPPKKHTTTLFHHQTGDEFRTRRGIVLVDDDFNVSPEPGVNQGWSDGAVKSTKTSTIDEGSGQEEPPSPPSPSPPDLDGSGDGDPTEPWTNLCLNSTCDSRDMSVFPGHDEIVPVGTNLTLSCVQSNESAVELRWYKYDGDGNPLLQNTIDSGSSELNFAITKSRTEDSGRYVCLRGSPTGSCCHRTLHVKVYEVPNYRYHLIVVGVVAAVSLFACILIGMCRNYKTKKYEVQLELQNMESDCVYKM